MATRWGIIGAVVVGVGALLGGCGVSGPTAGDRAACERYAWAHESFRSVVVDVSEAARSGGEVSESLREQFGSTRSLAYASIGHALAVADHPDLVIALRDADAAKAGLLSGDADAAAAYALLERRVSEWCSSTVGNLSE